MVVFNPFSWFKGKLTLSRVQLDDLKREQFKLEGDIRKLEKEEEQLNKEREQREDEYRVAHANGKEVIKKTIIRKLETLKIQSKSVATRLKTCYSIYQTTIGLIAVKENQAFFEKLGIGSLVMKMDIDELQSFIQEATIEGELQQEKLARLLGATNAMTETDGSSEAILISQYDEELLGKYSNHTESAPTTSTSISNSSDKEYAEILDRTANAVNELNQTMKENS
ncbi:MAG: hypothetical protein LBC74_00805 [Planctomycetaceae bacterium]|jgi:hypothetical protein|nr:hypothetical protein [Planctomycetaceae bacterium]